MLKPGNISVRVAYRKSWGGKKISQGRQAAVLKALTGKGSRYSW
nr:hypothetical protein [Pyrobaculum sp.]